jgi:hypothetical protein
MLPQTLEPVGLTPSSENSLKTQARQAFLRFVSYFKDSPTQNVHWMADNELPQLIGKKTIRRAASVGVEVQALSLFETLWSHNSLGMAIYLGVSAPIKDEGSEVSSAHMDYPRFLVCDFDCRNTEEFNKHREHLASVCETARLQPTFLIQTSAHKFHSYWKLSVETQTEIRAAGYAGFNPWSIAQRQLAAMLASDLSVHNPDRVFRVPGFKNYKGKASLHDGFTAKFLDPFVF